MSDTEEKLHTIESLLREAQRKLIIAQRSHEGGHSNFKSCAEQLYVMVEAATKMAQKL